jgi:hypothetical protein
MNLPVYGRLIRAAEQAHKTVEKIDVTYMRPTDFSPIVFGEQNPIWCVPPRNA